MRFVFVYMESVVFTNILTYEYTLGHQSLSVCEVSDSYIPIRVLEIHKETWKRHFN